MRPFVKRMQCELIPGGDGLDEPDPVMLGHSRPYTDSGLLQNKLIKGSTLKLYDGAPHGLATTIKDQINQDLFTFCQG